MKNGYISLNEKAISLLREAREGDRIEIKLLRDLHVIHRDSGFTLSPESNGEDLGVTNCVCGYYFSFENGESKRAKSKYARISPFGTEVARQRNKKSSVSVPLMYVRDYTLMRKD